MKKTSLILMTTSLILASCTLPQMPWSKTKTDTTEEVVTPDQMNVSGEVPVKNTDTTDVMPGSDTPQKQTDITPSDTPKAIATGGIYLPYTSTAVAQAKGNIVLFFHASWCPTCISIEKDINAHLKDIPKDLTILRVNYDEATDLKTLYGVTAQYTFVQVDNSGKLIKKWRGGSTLSEIIGQVQKSDDQESMPTDTPSKTIGTPEKSLPTPPPPPKK